MVSLFQFQLYHIIHVHSAACCVSERRNYRFQLACPTTVSLPTGAGVRNSKQMHAVGRRLVRCQEYLVASTNLGALAGNDRDSMLNVRVMPLVRTEAHRTLEYNTLYLSKRWANSTMYCHITFDTQRKGHSLTRANCVPIVRQCAASSASNTKNSRTRRNRQHRKVRQPSIRIKQCQWL